MHPTADRKSGLKLLYTPYPILKTPTNAQTPPQQQKYKEEKHPCFKLACIHRFLFRNAGIFPPLRSSQVPLPVDATHSEGSNGNSEKNRQNDQEDKHSRDKAIVAEFFGEPAVQRPPRKLAGGLDSVRVIVGQVRARNKRKQASHFSAICCRLLAVFGRFDDFC